MEMTVGLEHVAFRKRAATGRGRRVAKRTTGSYAGGLPGGALAVQAHMGTPVAEASRTGTCGVAYATRAVSDAEILRGEARSFMNSGRIKKAASLLAKSAGIRPACDPQVFQSFRLAARLYHQEGSMVKARILMMKAAENGAATGQILDAANAYVDAAYLATEECRPELAKLAAHKAQSLAGSPLLTERDRLFIASRIEVADPTTAMKKKSPLNALRRRTILPAATPTSQSGSGS